MSYHSALSGLFIRKDVRLPIQLQRAMAAEAEAARESRAKVQRNKYIYLKQYKPLDNSVLQVIAAEGEKTASVALRAASDNISGNHAAMQLRSEDSINAP